jgi:HEPN domain-containing protein
MNDLSREWADKAEADHGTALRESAVADHPNHDAVCFHAQQCVEKYLKAVLQEAGLYVPRTHDLIALLALALPVTPTLQAFHADLLYLTSFAVEFRYPGSSASADDAQRAVAVATSVRHEIRQHFGLP